jgi:hypothetical protein
MAKRQTTDEDQGVADDWVGPIEEAIAEDMAAIVSDHPAADGLRESAIRLANVADDQSEILSEVTPPVGIDLDETPPR